MVHLLDLPCEVRAEILSHALRYFRPSPTQAETERQIRDSECRHIHIHYSRSPSIDLLSLLLVNKQINHEVQAVLNSCRTVEYHLDLVVTRKCDCIIPEWTYVSRPSRFIDVLTCTVRTHGRQDPCACTWLYTNLRGNLYALIEEFCWYGLRLGAGEKSRDICDHYVRKLVFDIRSTVTENDVQVAPISVSAPTESTSEEQTTTHLKAEKISAKFIALINDLVDCDQNTCEYVNELFVHFGEIEVRRDGRIEVVFDLDAKLTEALQRSPPLDIVTLNGWRIYHIVQIWAPLMQRLRYDTGMAQHADPHSIHKIRAEALKSFPYYKPWWECLDEVHRMRPGNS